MVGKGYDFTRPYENPAHTRWHGIQSSSRSRTASRQNPQRAPLSPSPWLHPMPSSPIQSRQRIESQVNQSPYAPFPDEGRSGIDGYQHYDTDVDHVGGWQPQSGLDYGQEQDPSRIRGHRRVDTDYQALLNREPSSSRGHGTLEGETSRVFRDPVQNNLSPQNIAFTGVNSPVNISPPPKGTSKRKPQHPEGFVHNGSNPNHVAPKVASDKRTRPIPTSNRLSFFQKHKSGNETPEERERQNQKSLIRQAQLNHLISTRSQRTQAENTGEKNKEGLQPKKKKRWVAFTIAFGVFFLLALAIGLGVYFSRKKDTVPDDEPELEEKSKITGGDGSQITPNEGGATFTYQNAFGGRWYHDPDAPLKLDARSNSWTPPLNTTWTWGSDRIFGVNLGGWLVLQPFISPSLFQKYPGTLDEWQLSVAMRADEAGGGIGQIEEHYRTFINETDIAEIAGAGLNWIRIPIGFWAIDTWNDEPFLERTSWTYLLRAVEWARKYGLRVIIDLHTCPGSQNGFNQSGRQGRTNFLVGNMGIANAERTLYYIRILFQFFSQPEYSPVVPVINIVNEPAGYEIGVDQISSFYLKAYDMIRSTITGVKRGPFISVSGALLTLSDVWNQVEVLPRADRIVLDEHPYVAFRPEIDTAPIADLVDDGQPGGVWPRMACDLWGSAFNQSRRFNGITIGGEFSGATNDCGLFLRGVDQPSAHPQCAEYDNWESYNATMKAGIRNFVLASFDAIGDFFWWTWKIGPSQEGRVSSPTWSYKLGLENGWIPQDPRESLGKCAALGSPTSPFEGPYQPWQTGNISWEPSIPGEYYERYFWPPVSISGAEVAVSLLPTYTSTGTVETLPVPTFTGVVPVTMTRGLDGWFNMYDRVGGPAPVQGCPYPDAYVGSFEVLPTAPCTGPASTTTP